MAIVAQLGSGALNGLNVYFLTQNIHTTPRALGLISVASGMGSVVGALYASRFARLNATRTAVWLNMTVSGAFLLLYSRQTVFLLASIVVFMGAVPSAALNSSVGPLLLSVVPKEFIGRVVAAYNAANMVSMTLSLGVSGWLASSGLRDLDLNVAGLHVGPIDCIFSVSGLLIIGAGLLGRTFLPSPVNSSFPTSPTPTDTG
jgi:MFS family permease